MWHGSVTKNPAASAPHRLRGSNCILSLALGLLPDDRAGGCCGVWGRKRSRGFPAFSLFSAFATDSDPGLVAAPQPLTSTQATRCFPRSRSSARLPRCRSDAPREAPGSPTVILSAGQRTDATRPHLNHANPRPLQIRAPKVRTSASSGPEPTETTPPAPLCSCARAGD